MEGKQTINDMLITIMTVVYRIFTRNNKNKIILEDLITLGFTIHIYAIWRKNSKNMLAHTFCMQGKLLSGLT